MLLLTMFALATFAQDAPSPPLAATDKKPKKVCRTTEPAVATGTLMGSRRVCKTQEEWDRLRSEKSSPKRDG